MEPPDLADSDFAPAAARIVGDYLAELESRLPAGRRARQEIVLEIADGLACAVEEHVRRGQRADAAARTAVAELGDARTLAARFAGQLGLAAAHRLGAGLVVTGPLVGLTWVVAYSPAGPTWSSQIANVLSAMPQYPPILAVTVLAAMIAITGSGWPARHVILSARLVTAAAIVAVIGCVAGDLSLLSSAIVGRNLIATGPVSITALAIAASVVRLSAAAWWGRRIAQLRRGVR